eukprot:gene26934-35331_t
MANQYVYKMAHALELTFLMSNAEATALAWGGLGDTVAWQNLSPQQKQDILNINAYYKNINGTRQNAPGTKLSGKFINDELKARCAPRDGRSFVIGIYKFKVEQNGSVDSVVSLGNTGSYIDSLQIKEFRALRFKAFNNQQDMLQWFQIKIFGSYTTH